MELLTKILVFISVFIFVYTILSSILYFILAMIAVKQLRKEYQLDEHEPYEELMNSANIKPISIILPAFNEELGITDSIRSLLSIEYPIYELIVVNDGSTDGTMELLRETFKLVKVEKVIRKQINSGRIFNVYQSTIYPNLIIIDKENKGKADALNAGINASKYPIFCTIDADSVLERTAFAKVMKPMLEEENVIATSGTVRIANGCNIENGEVTRVGLSSNPLVIMQVIEYLRTFLIGRFGLSRLNLLLIISGTFGVFSKEWVIKAGGYSTDTVGEDMELVVRLHRIIKETKAKKRIVYIPDPVCWTEAPESLKQIRSQRNRWHRGLAESLWKHRSMLLHPKYGRIGLFALPYFTFIELIGPILELIGYFAIIISLIFHKVMINMAILLTLLAIFNGSILSMTAVLLEEWSMKKYPKISGLLTLFFFSLSESLWYRILTTYWKFEGLIHFLFTKRYWKDIERKGLKNLN